MIPGAFERIRWLTVVLLPALAVLTSAVWIIGRAASLDSEQVAFVSDQYGTPDLFLLDMPRRLIHRLTDTPANEREPRWSPSGRWLAFVSNADGDDEIYLLDVDTGNIQQITMNQVVDDSPSWSPVGGSLAFTSNRDNNSDVYVYGVLNQETRRLTDHPDWDSDPSWSPDGRWLVFVSTRSGNGSLYVMPSAGGEAQQITWSAGWHLNPSWSPDGRWIAFDSAGVSDSDIFMLDTACLDDPPSCDQTVIQLTHNNRLDSAPSWSPDSTRLIYYSGAGGLRYTLAVLPITCYQQPGGCDATAEYVTSDDFMAWSPAWKP